MAALFIAPTALRSASPSVLRAGGGAVRKDTGDGGGVTERDRKPAPVTCISCGHGPKGHNDEHRAYWVREEA